MSVDTIEKEKSVLKRPTRSMAEEAVRTLIAWAGEDPNRLGLLDTPRRVVSAYSEFFAGYGMHPQEILSTTFEDIQGYDDIVLLKDIRLESHCEHHLVPVIGVAHVGYIPDRKVVGLSKLARLVEIYAKRMQAQERMTCQIAQALEHYLQPKGVGVVIRADHQCMTMRGVHKSSSSTITSKWIGCLKEEVWRTRFYEILAQQDCIK